MHRHCSARETHEHEQLHGHRPRRRAGDAHEERARRRCCTRSAGRPHRPLSSCARRSTRAAARWSSSSGTGARRCEQYLARAFGGRACARPCRTQQRGTGDAARVGLARLRAAADRVLVLYGDVPLLAARTCAPVAPPLDDGASARRWRSRRARSTTRPATGASSASGGEVVADPRAHATSRTTTSARCARSTPASTSPSVAFLREALATLAAEQRAGRALPDRHRRLRRATRRARSPPSRSRGDVLAGVNDRAQLAEAEDAMHARIAEALARAGRHGARRRAHRRRASSSSPTRRSRAARSCAATTRIGARRRRRRRLRARRTSTSARARSLKPYTVATDSTHRRARADRPVLAPAARQRASARSARRQLRRDEEDAHGPRAPRPTTSPTSATATSARARTSAPAPSSATTTASRSTRRPSARAPSSAATRSSSRRSPSATARTSPPARR